jgi:hypothetical protein
MACFMVFIACSNAEKIDTMRRKLRLAWYQVAPELRVFWSIRNSAVPTRLQIGFTRKYPKVRRISDRGRHEDVFLVEAKEQ